jgi:beta-lactamase class A
MKILIFITTLSIILNGFFAFKIFTFDSLNTKKQSKYSFLSKRVFIENANDIIINFIPLRIALKEYVEKQQGKVGVYFEYLPSGTSIGVNDKEEVKIASLSKVPLVMSVFKKVERGEMSLDTKLIVEEKHLNNEFGNLWKSGAGTEMSVVELIRLTLTDSDNTAYNVLYDQLTNKNIDEVYAGLDINLVKENFKNEIYLLISPKNYSSILRSLYLSSFNSIENSNMILEILTETPFNNKINSGIPSNIKVAHKIGVFEKYGSNQSLFTDCGIVYAKQRPYILCIFVQDSEKQAQKHMSYISKMIYEYLSIINTNNKK